MSLSKQIWTENTASNLSFASKLCVKLCQVRDEWLFKSCRFPKNSLWQTETQGSSWLRNTVWTLKCFSSLNDHAYANFMSPARNHCWCKHLLHGFFYYWRNLVSCSKPSTVKKSLHCTNSVTQGKSWAAHDNFTLLSGSLADSFWRSFLKQSATHN